MSVRTVFLCLIAVGGLAIGYSQNPFGRKPKAAPQIAQNEAQALREKAHFYFLMRNYQGALDLTENFPSTSKEYEQVQIIRRMAQYKIKKNQGRKTKVNEWDYQAYPAAVRDSLFDSLYASSQGRCFDAYQDMKVVSLYTNKSYEEWIYNNCKESRDSRQPASERALEALNLKETK
ncbi:hypothetical protein DOE51_04045 [Bdellovibrio sp. NC01]|nr:hypothetical protein DOE51_04045 [Bdellovibrio sp. NC01]